MATRGESLSNIRQMPPAAVLREAPERLGLRVTMMQLAIYADLTPRFAALGLTSPSRMTALLHIKAHPGCSQSELAQFTGLSRTSAMTMVEQLERAGFVERRAGANARTNALMLTDAFTAEGLGELVAVDSAGTTGYEVGHPLDPRAAGKHDTRSRGCSGCACTTATTTTALPNRWRRSQNRSPRSIRS